MKPSRPIDCPYGYYEVAGLVPYLNKTEALYAASKYNKPVEWIFHKDVYGKIDWSKRPPGTLEEMYKQRAQQLRDTYDYIVVHFSGGMDSWSTLHSFLSNGIHVDEIYTRWALDELKYKKPDPTNFDQSNLISEYEYAVLPVLEHIRKTYPKIHIVIDDYSEDLNKDCPEDFVSRSHQFQLPATYSKFTRKSEFEKVAAKQEKKIGIVYSYDKVKCQIEGNNFNAYFGDRFGGNNDDPERNIEFFYWTRNFPEIPVLQAHCLKDFVKYNKEIIGKIYDTKDLRSEYRKYLYQKACYPTYNPNTFQVEKPWGSIVWKSNDWMSIHNPRYMDSWKWALGQYTDQIHDGFFDKLTNGMPVGLSMFRNGPYLIESNIGIDEMNWYQGWNSV
jgi:hypothetical protein